MVFALVVGAAEDRFYLTPLGLGLIYLAAAVLGGRRGGYWATTVVLLGWGAAVLLGARRDGRTWIWPACTWPVPAWA